MTKLPDKLRAWVESEAESYATGGHRASFADTADRKAFFAGADALYAKLLESAPEFNRQAARNMEMGTIGALTMCVDAAERGANRQFHQMSAQVAAVKEENMRLREALEKLHDQLDAEAYKIFIWEALGNAPSHEGKKGPGNQE